MQQFTAGPLPPAPEGQRSAPNQVDANNNCPDANNIGQQQQQQQQGHCGDSEGAGPADELGGASRGRARPRRTGDRAEAAEGPACVLEMGGREGARQLEQRAAASEIGHEEPLKRSAGDEGGGGGGAGGQVRGELANSTIVSIGGRVTSASLRDGQALQRQQQQQGEVPKGRRGSEVRVLSLV